MEMELAALQAQLERERAAAAERQADHADALASLDASRQRVRLRASAGGRTHSLPVLGWPPSAAVRGCCCTAQCGADARQPAPSRLLQVAALEGEVAASQREALDAKQELQHQAAEHEAETTAAAARITGGCCDAWDSCCAQQAAAGERV